MLPPFLDDPLFFLYFFFVFVFLTTPPTRKPLPPLTPTPPLRAIGKRLPFRYCSVFPCSIAISFVAPFVVNHYLISIVIYFALIVTVAIVAVLLVVVVIHVMEIV